MNVFTLGGADGVELAAVEWPGARDRSVLAVHATGFCKEVWEPVAAVLSAKGIRTVAIDQRGHGASSAAPNADWWGLGDDVTRVIAEAGPFDIGLGHSSGATALTMAALDPRAGVSGLVLAEPVVFPPDASYDESLAAQTLRRRSAFLSLDEAREHFAGRGIFVGWVEDALDGYLRGGLRSVDGGVELACSPRVEAEFYEQGTHHGVWDRLSELSVPTQVLVGAESTYHAGLLAARLARQYRAELVEVPNSDHFLPMQRPLAVVGAVERMLSRLT